LRAQRTLVVLKSSIIPLRRRCKDVRPRTLYVLTFTILGLITLAGIMFPEKRLNEPEELPELKGVTLELTHIWINYYNNSGLYQYGAQLCITNTRPSKMTLSNLQVAFSGEGRNRQWSGVCPTEDITLSPGESREINVYGPDVKASQLGYLGTTTPNEYLHLVIRQTNLGIRVALEGTDSSSAEATRFEPVANGFPTGNASTAEFSYARDVTNLGLDSQFLDSWGETFNYLPTQDLFKFQPLQRGVLGTARFPLLTVFGGFLTSFHSVSQSIVSARTITVSTRGGPKVYYLFSRGYSFDDYLEDGILSQKDGDSVYFYGDVFDYLAQTGTYYSVMFPTEVSSEEIRDPVEVAKGVIVSRVGEAYFGKYFSDPTAGYDMWAGNETHWVSFRYHILIGKYATSQTIYLYFDAKWRLTEGSEYLPTEGNFQPFKVTMEQAKEIAVKAGIPAEPYGLEAYIGNSGIWPDYPTEYQGKYVWSVGSWIDPPSANPRRSLYAVIDPVTGRLYVVEQGGSVSIGSIVN